MHTSFSLGAALVCLAGMANAAYTIQDSYTTSNFFTTGSGFTFFSGKDPTNGDVKYVTKTDANTSSLAGISNGAVYLGVDHTTVNPPAGRQSVRLESAKTYQNGLFIADIAHMPASTCGVWPAFWTLGTGAQEWPAYGEIDILEGVNTQSTNVATLHTSGGCTMASTGSANNAAISNGGDCNNNKGFNGCGINTTDTKTYGTGLNAIGGGVYAMEWTSSHIAVYFFPRAAIPGDITSGAPNPSSWGAPMAKFTPSGSGCDIASHFKAHKIVINTTFCGDWAGQVDVFGPQCQAQTKTTDCKAYVNANPQAFVDAYWLINSVKVYQDPTAKRDVVPTPFSA
ncbi:concanavalin A-like lectin/glucanase domain-containing protein [Halenospora varia]|nr:concanavalin A-like lectin/glucanase domain-containing protein [Halenospora varia]